MNVNWTMRPYTWLIATLLTSGCAASFNPAGDDQQPRNRANAPVATDTFEELINMPRPLGAIPAAVYSFRDYSGQYKPDPSNNLSTAVTQGSESILIKALLDSGWFIPLERSGLQNLLTERKILQNATLEANQEADPLPSMAAARVMFEGSIVSYDSNIATGGSGVRILGIGTSQTYREDRVTINLRVINIENGLVMHSVNSTKTIFSRQLNSGIFSYVDEDKILELEAGYSYNEPAHIAVVEAIESALINVVADGVLANSWSLKDFRDIESPAFRRYVSEERRERFIADRTALAKAADKRRDLIRRVKTRMSAGMAAMASYNEKASAERRRWRELAQRKQAESEAARARESGDAKPVVPAEGMNEPRRVSSDGVTLPAGTRQALSSQQGVGAVPVAASSGSSPAGSIIVTANASPNGSASSVKTPEASKPARSGEAASEVDPMQLAMSEEVREILIPKSVIDERARTMLRVQARIQVLAAQKAYQQAVSAQETINRQIEQTSSAGSSPSVSAQGGSAGEATK